MNNSSDANGHHHNHHQHNSRSTLNGYTPHPAETHDWDEESSITANEPPPGITFEESCNILLKYGRGDIVRTVTGQVPPAHSTPPALSASSSTHSAPAPAPAKPRELRIRFFDTDELAEYKAGDDIILVGDCHIMRGEVFVIGGEPGVGKSRSATALAVAGATCGTWFGMKIERPFRTMIIQTENGRYRLQQEYAGLDYAALKGWVRVSEPPPYGITLANVEFQEDIRAEIAAFRPDVIILDPWNAAARDDKQRDYSETFDALRRLLPTGPGRPALGIVAHTRKPQANEQRTGGTGLMHILAGSYMLTSVPRAVFIMVRASEDETDDRVVWFNPKNNNGLNFPRTAWHRVDHGFVPVTDFDWTAFEKAAEKGERKMVTLEHLQELFENCDTMELAEAVDRLAVIGEVSKPTAYGLLSEKGRFSKNLVRKGKMISFKE